MKILCIQLSPHVLPALGRELSNSVGALIMAQDRHWCGATILAVLGGAAAVLGCGATIQAVLRGAATIQAVLGGAAAILAGGGIETHFRSSGEHVTMKYFHLANHYPGTGCGGEGFGLET